MLQNQQRKSVELDREWDLYFYNKYQKPRIDLLLEMTGLSNIDGVIGVVINESRFIRERNYWQNFAKTLKNSFVEEKSLFKGTREILTKSDFNDLLVKYERNVPNDIAFKNDKQFNAYKKYKNLGEIPNCVSLDIERLKFQQELQNKE